MRYFSENEVREFLPMRSAIAAVRSAFEALAKGEAINQPRRRMFVQTGAVLHQLAGAYGKYFGTKIYATHPDRGAWFTFFLFDAETGCPVAQMEANYLGQIRTGATSGLAADLIAPQRPITLAVIGSGFQARSQVAAVAAVRSIEAVRVWSRQPSKREAFAHDIRLEFGLDATAAPSSAAATTDADLVITATYSKDPVLESAAIKPNALILAMGSNDPRRHEVPPDIIRNAVLVADDIQAAKIEAGDFMLALGEDEWSRVVPLADLVSGKTEPAKFSGLTVFKSVGLGIEDVAAGAVVYEQATLGLASADRTPATR